MVGGGDDEWTATLGDLTVEQIVPGCVVDSATLPDWLAMYALASPGPADHLLQWPLFTLAELEQYNDVLHKLYKRRVVATVIKYEAYRQALQRERQRRTLSRRLRHTPPSVGAASARIRVVPSDDDDDAEADTPTRKMSNQVTVNLIGPKRNECLR